VDIAKIQFAARSRDDIPAALKGLQHIYITPDVREKVFALLENSLASTACMQCCPRKADSDKMIKREKVMNDSNKHDGNIARLNHALTIWKTEDSVDAARMAKQDLKGIQRKERKRLQKQAQRNQKKLDEAA
jgi:hypothetical protein